jgi:acyl carrier protein
MDDIQDRLEKCFESVFPDLPAGQVRQCSQETNPKWDSIAAITLVNVIEDEFGFQIDFEVLPELNSFDRVLSYVKMQLPS